MINKSAYLILAALVLCHVPQLTADEAETEPQYSDEKNYVLGISGMEFSNIALFCTNRYIGQTEFSQVSAESIHDNFTGSWQWDSSTFHVNQIGHPYQGYTYYAAGRANNLNALESTLLAAMGSYSWEVSAERVTAATNDFISTTIGGIALGEMIHRIYLDTYRDNPIIASLISPMDAANDFVSGMKQRPTHSKIRSLTFNCLTGYRILEDLRDNEHYSKNSYHTVAAGLGFDLRYGDPFVGKTESIYDHFEFAGGFEGGYAWYDSYIVSDGVLVSITPEHGGPSLTSYGLNLHFDYYSSHLMDFSANSLTFTVQQERLNGKKLSYNIKANAGPLLFGSCSFMQNELHPGRHESLRRTYGIGGTGKFSLEIIFPLGTTISAYTAHYFMAILPDIIPDSEGTVFYNVASLSIKQPVNSSVSAGAITSFTWKRTRNENLPDHDKFVYKISWFLERGL